MKLIIILLFIIGLLGDGNGQSQSYPGTNLRGRIITYSYGQQMPLVSAKVDIFYFTRDQQWQFISSTLTDAYGFYYFRGIQPNIYTIWVNESKSYNIQVVPIDYTVIYYQDIPILFY